MDQSLVSVLSMKARQERINALQRNAHRLAEELLEVIEGSWNR